MKSVSAGKADDLKVFIVSRATTCEECGRDLEPSAWITLRGENGASCLSCADMDHLVFLPAGDAALTGRAKKNSRLFAVVLKWSRARKRYERQGLLVENEALEKAEQECEGDAAQREERRARAALRRAQVDQGYIAQFAGRIRELYPLCPPGREQVIAGHACQKYSGRVGRSEGAKNLDNEAVHLAVLAHLRHTETNYDDLLLSGVDRGAARASVRSAVSAVAQAWKG